MAVVSDQATAIGVTVVPTPVTDAGSDFWFLHAYLSASFTFLSAVGAVNDGRFYEIDSKAMRKVDVGQDLVVVGEKTGTSSGLTLFTQGRVLVKLH